MTKDHKNATPTSQNIKTHSKLVKLINGTLLGLTAVIIITIIITNIYRPGVTNKSYHNSFKTVTIGKQIWMTENINYDSPLVTCYTNTAIDPDFQKKYGCLYTFEDAHKVCPRGWHLPSKDEFRELILASGGSLAFNNNYVVSADLFKKSGFNPLITGSCYKGRCVNKLNFLGSDFWSSTENNTPTNTLGPRAEALGFDVRTVSIGPWEKINAFSVRCLKNAP